MGLFALVSTALSTYIWTITAWDVCRPLSSNSSAPFSILDLVRSQSQTPARRTTKRSHARMEAAQREEIRRSLKAAVIWLMLKGLEPVFDNSIGFFMPFYNLSKAFTLTVYICFRPELSRHLFDTFVLPIGKPNTPLLDLGAFNSIVIPTARFLLSLPFAHLVVAVKNQVEPLLQKWSDKGIEEEQTEEEEGDEPRRPSSATIAPPPSNRVASSARQASAKTSSGSSRSVSGKGGDDGEEGSVSQDAPSMIRKKPSVGQLSTASKRSEPRTSSVAQARALLDTLPPAPRDSLTDSTAPTSSATLPILQTFAYIPPATPPPAQHHKNGTIDSSQIFTPRMPGFLSGQGQTNGFNLARVSSAPSSSLASSIVREEIDRAIDAAKANGKETAKEVNEDESTSMQSSIGEAKSSTSAIRRKRAAEGPEVPPKKVRASPSRSKGRVRASPSVSTDSEMASTLKKSTSTARLPSSSLSTAPIRATVSRTRKKAA